MYGFDTFGDWVYFYVRIVRSPNRITIYCNNERPNAVWIMRCNLLWPHTYATINLAHSITNWKFAIPFVHWRGSFRMHTATRRSDSWYLTIDVRIFPRARIAFHQPHIPQSTPVILIAFAFRSYRLLNYCDSHTSTKWFRQVNLIVCQRCTQFADQLYSCEYPILKRVRASAKTMIIVISTAH